MKPGLRPTLLGVLVCLGLWSVVALLAWYLFGGLACLWWYI
jgi:hypothetical protein